MKFKSVYITRAIFISNVLFAVLLLLSYLAPTINPQQYWPLAFLGLSYPFLLIVNLVYLIYWLSCRKIHALISGLTILLGFNILLNCFGFRFQSNNYANSRSAKNLRIMAYNVHGFVRIDRPDSLSYQKILNLIKVKNPDIIAFEEFCSRNTDVKFSDSLKKILNNGQYYFEPFIKAHNDSTGLAIFSKFPIISHNIIRLSESENDNQGISVDVRSRFGTLRVYCFHLQSILLEPKDYKIVRRNNLFDKHSAHTTFEKLKKAYITRAGQSLFIKQQVKKCLYPYIIAGDFNDTPNSYTTHQMADGLLNAFREKGHGWGVTYNSGLSFFQIDYILANPKFNIINYQIVKEKISDHYPILADISLK